MAAGRIKGITIEIGGDTTKLTKALASVDNAISRTQQNLRDINRALKFDPSNVTLLKDKQQELAKQVESTQKRIEEEKKALEQLNEKLDQPFDLDHAEEFQKNAKAAEDLKMQIDLDTAALKELEQQAKQSASILGQQMQVAGQKIQEVGQKIQAVGDSISGIGTKITGAITVPLVAAGTKSVETFAEVDKTMQLTNATMANTAEEAQILEDAMKTAAKNSTFTMNEASTATLNYARAGLDATEASKSLAPAMNLAAGEGGNLDTVSKGLVGTINGFNDTFDQASHYADVFANACNNSALDVNSLSESMSIAAPVFNSAGKSVEDAALLMGIMANREIDANVAANSLKTGIARLADPTKQASKAMEEYGIAMSDIWNQDGSMKEMVEIQKNLHDSFAKLSEQEQIAAASAIFGKNQMAPWLALINTAPSEVDELSKALEKEGTTTEMANAMMSGFGGSLEKLKSSIDVAAYSFGEALAPTISLVVEKIQTLVDWFNNLDKSQQQAIAKQAMIVAAIGPALVIIGQLVSSVGSIVTTVGKLTSGIGSLLTSFGGLEGVLAALTGPIGIVVAAVAALAAGFAYLYATSEDFRATVDRLAGTVRDNFGKAMEEIKPKLEELGERFNSFMQTLEPVFEGILTLVVACVNGIISTIGPVVDFITGLVEVIMGIIQAFFALFTGDWDSFWQGIETIIDGAINMIEGFLNAGTAIWEGILSTFGINMNLSVTDMWEKAKRTIQNVIEMIRTDIKEKWNDIKTWLADTLHNIWDKFKEIFEEIRNSVKEKIDRTKDAIQEGMENALDYLASLPSRFFNWGAEMIGNLIDGIKSKFSDLVDAVGEVAETIAEYIHFSEPDVGPLSNFHTFMPDMIDMMVNGINQGIPKLQKAMGGMTGSMATSMQGGGTTYAGTNNVNVTVYGAPGQDVSALADIIEQKIAMNSLRRGAAGA